MKRQKIRKDGFYGETIFNLACYNLSRSYTIGEKNTKKAIGQYKAVTNYLEHVKTQQEKEKKRGV